MLEKDFQNAVMELARFLGWKVLHFSDSRRQVRPGVFVGDKDAAGWPDLFLVRERCIAMELKAPKGKTTDKQEEWLDALDKAGIPTYVFRPADMPMIQQLLSKRAS